MQSLVESATNLAMPTYVGDGWELTVGDCREVMRTMPSNSVDSIVTDPPYGLSFMGKGWDHGVPGVEFWREALRVAKPGAHLIAFGGTRTYHRLAVAIEDAGWEVRDCLGWLYGSGFPKSHNISKAIDKAAGAERKVVGFSLQQQNRTPAVGTNTYGNYRGQTGDITAPATDLAKRWEGWGTALKPAWEPIILARKPLAGTVAANVVEHGTGGLNIDGCRVDFASDADRKESTAKNRHADFGTTVTSTPNVYGDYSMVDVKNYNPPGRFPANIIHDGSDEATAPMGEASRFFYCAKTSKRDRNDGLDGKNHHPTVKPTELMAYLCRLVTPPGGVVLDPFMGSGSTGRGAIRERFDFIGIDLDPEYVEIANARVQADYDARGLF